jgi:lipopolysaccharide export LptBFGC system permease protein LptF
MGGDSELVAFRAAGAGAWRLAAPLLAFGCVVAALTTFDAFVVAPNASRSLREATLRATLDRLESPIQPGTFNTQLPGKVIYVRDGDESAGEWGRVFIHWSEPGSDLRLVTARKGRIDLSGDQSELVLSDAVVTTLPASSSSQSGQTTGRKFITERSAQLRVRLNTGRAALLNQFARPADYDEMDWRALLKSYGTTDRNKQHEAASALHKRLALAMTPIPFVLLGIGLGGRARRGGKALGAGLSLVSMIVFYLLFLGGDYLTRTGAMTPIIGAWAATAAALAAGIWTAFFGVRLSTILLPTRRRGQSDALPQNRAERSIKVRRVSLLGLLDRTIIVTLTAYFSMALIGLVAIFLIFTFFEMLRFAAADSSHLNLIAPYLFYLTPLAIEGVMPVATLISILITYALMSRWGESTSWLSGGQSLYRLALPSLGFTFCVCCAYWLIQEHVLPFANARQELLRSRIRKGPARGDTGTGFSWLTTYDGRIYSYQYEEGTNTLQHPAVYLFDDEGVHLRETVEAGIAHESPQGGTRFEEASIVENLTQQSGSPQEERRRITFDESTPYYLFKPPLKNPEESDTASISTYIKRLRDHASASPELAIFTIALWRRRVEPLSAIVMWFVGVPLGLAFGRKTVVMPLMMAVSIGVCHWIGSAMLAQAGMYGLIPASASTTIFPAFFLLLGIYFFSRIRT